MNDNQFPNGKDPQFFNKGVDRRDFLKNSTKVAGAALGLSMLESLIGIPVEAASTDAMDTYDPRKGSDDQPAMVFAVISDTHIFNKPHVHDRKLANALQDFNAIAPRSSALVVNGDITDRGFESEYAHFQEILDQNPHPRKMIFSMGNHEFYKAKWVNENTLQQNTWPNGDTEQAAYNRFFQFAHVDKPYYEKMVDGYPFIVFGTEKHMHYKWSYLWDEQYISVDQFDWLRRTLAKHKHSKKPIFMFTHHPIPNTVSRTDKGAYFVEYLQADDIVEILKDYPQVILFTGHSHQDLKNQDWAVTKTAPGANKGFTVVNTSSVGNVWTSDAQGAEVLVGPDESQGIFLEVYKRKVVIKGRDFFRKQWIQEFSVDLSKKGLF